MKYTGFQRTAVCLLLIVLFVPLLSAGQKTDTRSEVVIAMCRPEIGQIKNIEVMLEKDIITLKRLKLIGIYHENENIKIQPALDYVKKNNLTWVTFETIKGKVELKDIFKENAWTPQFRKVFEKTSGIIFTGGEDAPPAIYGQDMLLLTEAGTPIRSMYEVSFEFHLLGGSRNNQFKPFLESRKDYVVLGICLGCQTMNIACGGTLYQDIPSQVYNTKTVQQVLKNNRDKIHSGRYVKALHPLDKNLAPAFHRIKLNKNSKFVHLMKMKKNDTPLVLTSHHQGVDKVGKNLRVTATSMDGKIVEAMEHKKYKNVLGVQFHPEVYKLYMKTYYYREAPGKPLNFNLRDFLIASPPSMKFHENIWQWFSERVANR